MLSVQLQHRLGAFGLDTAFQTERDAGVLAIAGASGAGKSSVLRCMAGLEQPQRGRVELFGRVVLDTERGVRVPVHQRRMGVVFQDSRLFPHLTVQQNLRYGQPRNGRPHTVDFDRVIAVLGIEHLLERQPASLSGGEQQRVAMGRALLSCPELLLMDEPLASLDPARKLEVLPFLAELPRRFAIPIVYVTHSMDEVLHLADELVVMNEGRVVDHGPVIRTLATLSGELGVEAVLEGTVGPTAQTVRISDALELQVLGVHHLSPGDRARMRIPADDVLLAVGTVPSMSVRNRLDARVEQVRDSPRGILVELSLAGAPGVPLHARVSRSAVDELALRPGLQVTALVKAASIRVPGMRDQSA